MNRGSRRAKRFRRAPTRGFNEAPIHESGKLRIHIKVFIVFIASMRPRFMNRGSPSGYWLNSSAAYRFNEAPIHESGKLARCVRLERTIPGFNEAPIHESGK